MSYVNLQGLGDVEISEGTMGRNKYSYSTHCVQALVALREQENKSGLTTMHHQLL